MSNSTNIEVLYDHYKDSFDQIRQREKQRDRLFLILLGLLGGLVLQLSYTQAALPSEIEFLGIKADIQKVPMPAVVSTTWTFLASLLLRYCQVSIQIERLYFYLHDLEKRLSATMEMENAIYREGRDYFQKQTKSFREYVWQFYRRGFPAVVLIAVGTSIFIELNETSISKWHKGYDLAVAVAVAVLTFIYAKGLSSDEDWNQEDSDD